MSCKVYKPRSNIVKDANGDVCRSPQYFEQMEQSLVLAIERTWR